MIPFLWETKRFMCFLSGQKYHKKSWTLSWKVPKPYLGHQVFPGRLVLQGTVVRVQVSWQAGAAGYCGQGPSFLAGWWGRVLWLGCRWQSGLFCKFCTFPLLIVIHLGQVLKGVASRLFELGSYRRTCTPYLYKKTDGHQTAPGYLSMGDYNCFTTQVWILFQDCSLPSPWGSTMAWSLGPNLS